MRVLQHTHDTVTVIARRFRHFDVSLAGDS